MNYVIELQRNNVTIAEFLRYIKKQCAKKGIDFDIDREQFENPYIEYSTSYTVIDGKKHCRYCNYQTTKRYRRKLASYTTPEGLTRFYYTDEFEEYEETELVDSQQILDAVDVPCKAETYKSFAYDYQTYVLNFDGSSYNEICEFTFDDGKRGHGYYYQAGVDV